MPLIGIIEPTAQEAMPHAPRLPKWRTPEELYDKLRLTPLGDSPWTAEMLNAALEHAGDRGDMISTTALTAMCPRSEVLKRKEDYVADLNDLWAALRGTLIHRTLELSEGLRMVTEVRFYTTVDGLELSGKPDVLTETELADYKVPTDQASVPQNNLYLDHTEQLMINAFICRRAERWEPERDLPFDPRQSPVGRVGIVFLLPKRPKVMIYKRTQQLMLASGKMKKVRLPYVWTDSEVLSVVRPRLHLLRHALDSYPEWPQPWTDPETGQVHTAEGEWGGSAGWECPGWPYCKLMTCLAKRYPKGLVW